MTPSPDFLATMAERSRERARLAQAERPADELRSRIRVLPAPPRLSLSKAGFDLLAEVKFSSPSAGELVAPSAAAAAERAGTYARAGACAVSVLTEPSRFAGGLDHLAAAAAAVQVPVLRKDFLVDPYQILEARAEGAGGVLLIARLLSFDALELAVDIARGAGLFALVEAFDEADLGLISRLVERTPAGARPPLVGVNARDLETLEVHFERLLALAPALPPGVTGVAESGIRTPEEAARAAAAGYRAALVGTALMEAPDPGTALAELLEAGRRAAGLRAEAPR